MARKWPVFFCGLQPLLVPRAESGYTSLLTLLALFLSVGLGPVASAAERTVPVPHTSAKQGTALPLLVQQGRDFYEAEQFSDAAGVWQQAAQTYQAQGDKLNQAMVLSNLSLAYQQLGRWPQATEAIAASLQLLQPHSQTTSASQLKVLAQALNTQGSLQLAQGQAEQALAKWQRAAATYAQAKDDTGMIRSEINQAQALQALGLYRRALTTLTQVNQTLQKQPNSSIKAAGLRNLGNALRVVGDLGQSRQVLQQSLTIAQELKSPPEIGATLFSLGNTAQAQQDTAAALAFYRQAAAAPTPSNQINVQLNQLDLLVETQQWSAAQELSRQVQSHLNNLPLSRTAIYARIDFAQSLVKMGRWGDREIGKQNQTPHLPTSLSSVAPILATAVQQAKSLGDRRAEAYALGNLGGLYEQTGQWSSAQTLTQQALVLAQATNAPDIAYRWQWQLGRILEAQQEIPDAIAAYTEAVNTLQSLRNDLVAINPDIQLSFREEVEPVYRQLVDLLLRTERAQPSRDQSRLAQARVIIESLQLAELNNFFRAACLDAQPVAIDQVIDQESTAAVVYPIVLPDRLEIILKLPRQPLRHYTTPIAQKQVESTLEELRRKLVKPYTLREVQSLSQDAYNWLVQPAEADLARSKVNTLVFVLDGPLQNMPMGILYDGQQYLVQKYGVALTPSLQLVNPKPLERKRIKALAAGLAEPRHGFAQLNYVESELAQIKSQVPSAVLLNQAFTETTLQEEINASPFPVVHLATHGQFSSKADQTFVLAWDKPINVSELDTLLRSGDQTRPGAIELLVLSACETAAGDKRAALGLAGVAVRAGARSTLASLWSLDDETSALLMSQFYQELANTNVTKAEALRRAQLTLLQSPQYQHPRYWAPYVLLGNWL